jgi:hypothetical protein
LIIGSQFVKPQFIKPKDHATGVSNRDWTAESGFERDLRGEPASQKN